MKIENGYSLSLREKCPNTEFFSGPYFPAYTRDTEYLSVFSSDKGKYGPEKTLHTVYEN